MLSHIIGITLRITCFTGKHIINFISVKTVNIRHNYIANGINIVS